MRIQVPDFLQPAVVEAFARELAERVPWQLAERSDGESRLSPRGAYPAAAEYARLRQCGYARDRQLPVRLRLLKGAKKAWDPGLLAWPLQFLNTPPYIEFACYLGNGASITRTAAQCIPCRPGHYVMPHEDLDEGEGRPAMPW